MSIQDPFFAVRDEVQQALMTARSLFSRWQDIQQDKLSLVSPEEKEYTTNELRNSLRSIDWDLEDLEETVSIVEKNPKKFKIDEFELNDRRNFIERSRAAVQELRRQMNEYGSKLVNGTNDSSNAQGSLSSNGLNHRPDHYAQLDVHMESVVQGYREDHLQQQQQALIQSHDSPVHMEPSITVSRTFPHQNSNELEDQNALLDELGHDAEQPETRLSRLIKRVTSLNNMTLDRRQWLAISLLLISIIILLIVFFTL